MAVPPSCAGKDNWEAKRCSPHAEGEDDDNHVMNSFASLFLPAMADVRPRIGGQDASGGSGGISLLPPMSTT